MFAIKRFAPAAIALAVVLSGCGTDGDVTTTDPAGDADTTPESEQSPTDEPSEPDQDEPAKSTAPPTPPGKSPSEPPADEGSGQDDPGDAGEPEADPTREPGTELTVVVDSGSGGEPAEWTITCDPAGGSMADPDAACETLSSISPRDVIPVPRDANCTMQYGGPQTALVTGIWNGTKVDLVFSRENGCEIARWDKMEPVLPATDGALL